MGLKRRRASIKSLGGGRRRSSVSLKSDDIDITFDEHNIELETKTAVSSELVEDDTGDIIENSNQESRLEFELNVDQITGDVEGEDKGDAEISGSKPLKSPQETLLNMQNIANRRMSAVTDTAISVARSPWDRRRSEPVISSRTVKKMRAATRAISAFGQMSDSGPALFKEPAPTIEDPATALRNKVCQVIKGAFTLAYIDGEDIKLNVDNVYPLLKTLGLNPQSESVVDLVREASIESYGDIDPRDFENVVLKLVKEKDEELWTKRLEEKEHLHRLAEAEKAKAEADRMRLEADRRKAGFSPGADDDEDEWREYERRKQDLEAKRQRELREDELYDNLRMAFRFIDADDDGVISTQDLYKLMMGLGEMLTDDELFGMLNMADTDCDGKVTFEDFKTFLIPQSGDETLIISPAAIASKLLENKVLIPEAKEKTENQESSTTEAEQKIDGAENDESSAETILTDTVKDTKQSEDDVNDEHDAEKESIEDAEKRRKSKLWGYSANSSPSTTRESLPSSTSTDDEVFRESVTDVTTPTLNVEFTDDDDGLTSTENDVGKSILTDSQDQSAGLLHSILEEDEHSNYETDAHVDDNADDEVCNAKLEKPKTLADNKRKLFSRQSSSNSLKTKINESFGDSGIDTMDSVNCSETREQPDVFDVDSPEDELPGVKNESATGPPARDIYVKNEDDEDMIDEHHVHESLSRVSSIESLSKLEELESEMPTERVLNFVNDMLHIDAKGDELSQLDRVKLETEQRLIKAETLQKAIAQHSMVSPQLTVIKSSVSRSQTARPTLNGIQCSHIDIDLTCEAPPKADIKSYRQFNDRLKSARTAREISAAGENSNRMSVIDMCEKMNRDNGDNASPCVERGRFPMRLLTRPRSPATKRRYAPREKNISLDLKCVSVEKTPRQSQSTEIRNLPNRRTQSANPLGRSQSARSSSATRQPLKRPQTASLPYTSSRFDDDKRREILVSEPFANSDELYPNKTMLTSYHHGFRSFWPIGRKINVIQSKKPFQAFEMNSYSRAIERRQLPFKGDHSIAIKLAEPVETKDLVKPLTVSKNMVNLSIDETPLPTKRPPVRKLSLYMPPHATPRSVRTVR